MPEICEEVFAVLPEDIQQELIEEQQRVRLLQESGRSSSPTKTAPHQVGMKERVLHLPSLLDRPTFTSRKLWRLPDLRDAVASWYEAFSSSGPFEEDAMTLGDYLRRVVIEEKDMDKASSVVRWLGWLIDDGRGHVKDGGEESSSQSIITWEEAFRLQQQSVEDAVRQRGLPMLA